MTDIMNYAQKNEVPFEYADLTSEDYIPIDSVVGKEFRIDDVKTFENDKGKGVYMLITIGMAQKYICTHAVGIVKTFDNEILVGDIKSRGVRATIVKRKSMKSDRMVYAFA